MTQKRVVTIQDISCVGKCSLTVALPILSAAGIETSILPTAILSTHTGGFVDFTFRDLTEDVVPITNHWKALDLKVDAIYTGYLGSEQQQQLIADIFHDFRQPGTIILVDPAMADLGEFYPAFDQAFALGMRDLCAQADIICPNITEACFMLQRPYPGEDYTQLQIEEMLRELAALGPDKVVLTGVSFDPAKVGAAAYDRDLDSFEYYFTERVEGHYHGTGDIYSSALLAGIMNDKPLADAIRIACEFTTAAIRRTHTAATDPKYGVDFEHELPTLIALLA